MVNWKKRVTNFSDNGLRPGEEVLGVAFLQPVGALVEATAKGSFGLLGMFVGRKMTASKRSDNDLQASSMSKAFPDGVVIVAVTDQGIIYVYEQAALSGKPKKLLKTYKKGDFTVHDIKKGALKSDMTLAFKDGGLRSFDLAKGQDYTSFADALAL